MNFADLLTAVTALLQTESRVSYRALKRHFEITDDDLEDIKAELIDAKQLARDEDGKVLVWLAGAAVPKPTTPVAVPADYTPAHLAERIRAAHASLETARAPDGERKTITALFADLKGSTALIEQLDPEEARAVIDPALQIMMDAVHQFDGYVAQALGDGVFALFGAPIALEDHAQRAVHAGLAMQRAMQAYSERLRRAGRSPLDLRVGINTGDVVLRDIRKDDLHTDYVPIGHSTNLAARAEQLAAPGTVVITEHTHLLIEGYFTEKPLGAASIKGMDAPLALYEVTGGATATTRLQIAATRGLSRFVGRGNELAQLRELLAIAQAGRGQVAGIVGEPGLGKSRLLHEFKLAVPPNWRTLEAHGVSFAKGSAYLPVLALLHEWFGIQVTDDAQARRAKIIGQVMALDAQLQDILPFLLALLGLDEQDTLAQMDAHIRRRRTHDALRRLWLRASAAQPLLLIVEDLHWIDSETQGVLDNLVEHLGAASCLLLVNYRPEYQPPWSSKTYFSQIRLAPLRPQEGETLLESLVGSDPQLNGLKRSVLERTEGTPFFIEEVIQSLVEQGVLTGRRGAHRAGALDNAMRIPTTVQGVLAARIDRLPPPEKELLQELATIGREFSWALLRKVISKTDDELERSLTLLQNNEFIYPQATAEPAYMFKHALTQEVAYGAILLSRRKELHERVGHALETLHALQLEEHYATLAHHYSHSDNTAKAVTYLKAAGIQAAKRCAFGAALQFLDAGVARLSTQAESHARDEVELDCQLWRGISIYGSEGLASNTAAIAYRRAGELASILNRVDSLIAAKLGEAGAIASAGDIVRGKEIMEPAVQLARSIPDSPLLGIALANFGWVAYTLGNLREAHRHLAQALEIASNIPLREKYAQWIAPDVLALGFIGKTLVLLGHLEQAVSYTAAAVQAASKQEHPMSISFTRYASLMVHCARRDWAMVIDTAHQALTMSEQYELPLWRAWANVFLGYAYSELGDLSQGSTHLGMGFDEFTQINSQVFLPFRLTISAKMHAKRGEYLLGLEDLDNALAHLERTSERQYEAEVHRMRGELLIQAASPAEMTNAFDQAERSFKRAVEIAQGQDAKLLELRALTSLARLDGRRGDNAAALTNLRVVYDWFTEGLETPDLCEARALLDASHA